MFRIEWNDFVSGLYDEPEYVYMETENVIALGIITDNLHTEYNKKLWLEIDK